MGTNYYMLTQNKAMKNKYFPDDCVLTDYPDLGYCIHICKKSIGWKTLFQSHPKAYNSVAELEAFILTHKEDFIFFDEYNESFTAEDFVEHIKYLDRDKNGNIGSWNKGTKPLICHEEYKKEHPEEYYNSVFHSYDAVKYWQDEDGYDFTEGEFS